MSADAASRHIAIDLGASGGRVAVGAIAGERMQVEVVQRFANEPLERDGGLYWDFERIWREIQAGLAKAGPALSVGCDSWAVDYALLDSRGQIIDGVRHYRDPRTEGVMETFDQAAIYAETGIQFLPFNTLYQLAAHGRDRGEDLEKAWHLLMVPDLVHHRLCGSLVTEETNASTTQMWSPITRTWSDRLVRGLEFLPEIVRPGAVLGDWNGMKVVAPATHDTASAVAAVPAEGSGWAYISSGTWSLVGVERIFPVITDEARRENLTNEAGVNGTTRLLKNMAGLWILQECRRVWGVEFDQLYAEAEGVTGTVFDPDDAVFAAPGEDMPERVGAACGSGQRAVMVRSILESLAAKTATILDTLERVTGQKIERVHIVGGGSQIDLLNRLICKASQREVIAGPTDATLTGNLLVQAEAMGTISQGSIRQVVKNSFALKRYAP